MPLLEELAGKRILIVTPHPDDDTFCMGGTMALLARTGADIRILILTSDNAGSLDPEMTHERLAAIRKAEEEEACAILGVPAANIEWLGHDDGMLEYADQKTLTRDIARSIRKLRPAAVFAIDPGAGRVQWHKSDHRMAAVASCDAMRAASWRLYFPELEREEGLAAYSIPAAYLYYTESPNETVDVTAVVGLKAKASAAHISQHGDTVRKYDPARLADQKALWERKVFEMEDYFPREGDRHVERFRRTTMFGQ